SLHSTRFCRGCSVYYHWIEKNASRKNRRGRTNQL
ncbi:L-fucose-proton symporter, partial [Haemophilus influenzae]